MSIEIFHNLVYLDFHQHFTLCYYFVYRHFKLKLQLCSKKYSPTGTVAPFLQYCQHWCALSKRPHNNIQEKEVGPKRPLHSVSGRLWHFLILTTILWRGERNQQQNNGGPWWPRFQMLNRGKTRAHTAWVVTAKCQGHKNEQKNMTVSVWSP